MKNYLKEISIRLKEVRTKYYEPFKLSTSQFANELGENEFNLQNYEVGKASIPARLLISLYYKGINPIYILTGEGDVYTDTQQGQARREKMQAKSYGSVHSIKVLDTSEMSVQELISKASEYTAAAGDIMKLVKEKQKFTE